MKLQNTDRAEQIRILEKLLEVAVTSYQRIRVLLALISSRFDYNSAVSTHMPPELWLSAQREVDQLVSIVASDTQYSVQEITEDYDETAERSPATEGGVVRIRGSIISFIDRLDDEFTKSLQNIDPHGTEYVDRLKDEKVLYCTICRAQAFYEKTQQADPLARVIMRRLEHIYSKVCRLASRGYSHIDSFARSPTPLFKLSKPRPTSPRSSHRLSLLTRQIPPPSSILSASISTNLATRFCEHAPCSVTSTTMPSTTTTTPLAICS
jgi:hypothetical protein